MKENERIGWIDISKGIAITMVVLGHSFRDQMRLDHRSLDFIYRCLYIFHMSFFFWLSGYTYSLTRQKKKSSVLFLKKKLSKQLLPWVLYSFFIYLCFYIASLVPILADLLKNNGYPMLNLKTYLLRCLAANNPYAYHLWFIYILFLISCIVFFLDTNLKQDHFMKTGIGLSVVCFFILFLFRKGYFDINSVGRVIQYLCIYIPFFIMGIVVPPEKVNKSVRIVWAIVGLIYIVIRALFFSGFNGNEIVADSLIVQMIVLFFSYTLLPGAMLLLCSCSKYISSTKAGKIFRYMGKNSFYIYLLHQPFCCGFIGIFLYNKIHLSAILTSIVCIIASFLISLIAMRLLKEVKSIVVKLEVKKVE